MTEERKKIWKDFWTEFGWTILLVVALVAILLLTLWHFHTRAATVNGSAISRLDVIRELENESGEAMLDSLVTKKIIAQKATEAGIKIDEAEVEEAIRVLEEQIAAQGSTLDVALEQQGITREKFREQITLQKALEKLLADKVAVSDEEVDQYLTNAKITAPEGISQEDFKAQIKEQLMSQKLGSAAQEWIDEQKRNSTIKYFVPYAPVEEETLPTPEAPAPNAPAPAEGENPEGNSVDSPTP